MPPTLIIILAALLHFAALSAARQQEISTPLQRFERHAAQYEWPSLRLNFTIKRSTMQVLGRTTFSVFANPVVFTDYEKAIVRYNTFASFAVGPTIYNYTVLDGVTFASSSSPDFNTRSVEGEYLNVLPSINSIVAALNNTTRVSSISRNNSEVVECSSGRTFKFPLNGIDFGLCATGSSGFAVYGSDVDFSVEYLENHVTITPPNADSTAECKTTVSPSAVSPMVKSLLTGEMIPSTDGRKLKAQFDFSLEDSCSCQSTPRPCLFVHGLKLRKEELDSTGALPIYWGNIVDHAPCCTSMKFAVLDTINISWTDDSQQQKVCDLAVALSNTSEGTTISDTIIVTHSMGGLIMAGAIANDKCSLASTSTWVSSAAPMKGSMVSDYFQDSCNDDTNFVAEKVVELTNLCPAGPGIQSLAYEGESHSSVELNADYVAAQEAYRKNVYALMCSRGPGGVLSLRVFHYWAFANIIPHKSKQNDGIVEFQSCAVGFPESEFGDTYLGRFYAPNINHADAAFRSGDALLNKAKMPVKWFECLL